MLNYAKTEISGFWGVSKDIQLEIFKMAGIPLVMKVGAAADNKKP